MAAFLSRLMSPVTATLCALSAILNPFERLHEWTRSYPHLQSSGSAIATPAAGHRSAPLVRKAGVMSLGSASPVRPRSPQKLMFLMLLAVLIQSPSTSTAAEPLRTYEVNYRFNAVACVNPYLCGPGAIHVTDLAPGRYRVVRLRVLNPADDAGGAVMWVGTASAGTSYAMSQGPFEIDLQEGQALSFFYIDPFPGDNSASIGSTIEIYAAGCQIKPSDVTLFAGGLYSLSGEPTTMIAAFTPTDENGLPIGIDAAKAACGVTRFNFQQTVDVLPGPSPFFPADPVAANWPVGRSFTAPFPRGPIPDPPAGGYTYNVASTQGRYPFYWPDDPADLILRNWPVQVCRFDSCSNFVVQTDFTLYFLDAPAHPCLLGGNGTNCTGFAPPFSDVRFTTKLVGVTGTGPDRAIVDTGFTWSWISNFNGLSGGIQALSNYEIIDRYSGKGGVTIASINGVEQALPVTTCSAAQNVLWPPSGQTVNVRVSGTIGAGSNALAPQGFRFVVTDSYGAIEPTGPITIDERGLYSFEVGLIASRNGFATEGRLYTVHVLAEDAIGNVAKCNVSITVPHDRSK